MKVGQMLLIDKVKDQALRAYVEHALMGAEENRLHGSLPADGKRDSWEEGSTTVEYAVGTIAAAGFAALLIAILKSGAVKTALTNIIQSALTVPGS